MWKNLKYFIAFVAPVSAIVGFQLGGIGYFSAFIVGFVLIPFFEGVFKGNPKNLSEDQEVIQENTKFFDWYLYLNIPVVYTVLYLFFNVLKYNELTHLEYFGVILSTGVILGTSGINVAHELGHRKGWFDQLCSKLLLLPAVYTHFTIQHNLGHHKNVATDKDPATAKYGQMVYVFWIKSIFQNYLMAWRLSFKNQQNRNKIFGLFINEMFWLQVLQIFYLLGIYYFFGAEVLLASVLASIIGILLLETVNYIEHYGLTRKKISETRYEPVSYVHSWNSEHELGRIFLFELTRHSDHHFKSTRKYQVLRYFNKSPQLPYGYPTSILISLLPPLWFKIMNKRVQTLTTD